MAVIPQMMKNKFQDRSLQKRKSEYKKGTIQAAQVKKKVKTIRRINKKRRMS